MQFTVGQKIFGRTTYNYSDWTGEVEEYIIDKVGTKYIYVRKEEWSARSSFPVCKDTLWCKDSWRNLRFFSSTQAINEYDEEESLFKELRNVFSCSNRGHEFGVSKLRAIKTLLDDKSNSSFVFGVHGLVLTEGEKETIGAILSMGLERVNPDKYPKVMVHSVIHKVLKYVYRRG